MEKGKVSLIFKVILKSFAALLFGGLWILAAFYVVQMQFEEGTDYYNSEAYYINECDEYYYEKEYSELYEFIHLYNLYGEEYDMYREVLNAYLDLQEYLKWKNVPESQIGDAREMEEMYYQKVINAGKNCRFSQNQKYLDDFAKTLQP